MDFFIDLLRLLLAGVLAWGGWLSLSYGLRGESRATAAPRVPADGFERVASLVLLALLCTTMAGLG